MNRPARVAPVTARTFASEASIVLREIVESLAAHADDSDSFLTTLGSLLEDVRSRLDELDGGDEQRIVKLLGVFETLTRWPLALVPPKQGTKFAPTTYTNLHNLLRGRSPSARQSAKKDAETRIHKLSQSRDPKHRRRFKTSISNFANTQKPILGPLLSDLVVLNGKPTDNDKDADSLRMLHTSLYSFIRHSESCGGEFTVNIALARVDRLDESKEWVPFKLFLLHRHRSTSSNPVMWKEIHVRVCAQSQSNTRAVQIQPVSANGSPPRKIASPRDFCQLISRQYRGCLVLDAAENRLAHVGVRLNVEELSRLLLLQASSVSLATVLERRKLNGDYQLKVLLSYLLAKAVWQFYDSDWMERNWTKHTIHFMREQLNDRSKSPDVLTLIHRPFFATELSSDHYKTRDSAVNGPLPEHGFGEDFSVRSHPYPKVLSLGIMLLEIELGEGIEAHQGSLDQHIENEDHYTAGLIILSPSWRRRQTYQAVKEIIEICLKPDTGKLGTDVNGIRDNVYTYIVGPLGRLFKQAWSRDKDPEAFSPSPVRFSQTELPLERINPDCLGAQVVDSLQPVPSSDAASTPETLIHMGSCHIANGHEERLELSGCSDEGESLLDQDGHRKTVEQRRTDKWFRGFQNLFVEHDIARLPSTKRLKVAILDSGITYDHPVFSREDHLRIKERISFIGGDANTDSVGHGTYIAAIILRLAKNVDLYIGKVTDCDRVGQKDKVRDAIKCARLSWQVDIISLSFGFESVQAPDEMGKEIEACLNSGIIVFASASNDGGEGSRTYPARYHRVICVHSAAWHGKASEFNPASEEDADNFSVVGECIRPIWRARIPKQESQMGYRRGTSFATPVAVCIAAFMIGYIETQWPDYPWIIKPKSPEGMRRIFKLMGKRMGDYDWISPTRYIRQTENVTIEGDLNRRLK